MRRLSKEQKERAARLARKRFLHELERRRHREQLRRQLARRQTAPKPPESESPTLKLYATEGEVGAYGKKRQGRDAEVEAPAVFSFIDAPNDALAFMAKFVRAAMSRARTINVRQFKCREIDLCAGSVLNALAMEAKLHHRCSFRGDFPRLKDIAEIIAATGLPKALEVNIPVPTRIDFLGLIQSGASGVATDTSSTKEKAAEKLVAYLDRILGSRKFVLNTDGREHFLRLITEVLGNVEEHSGRKDWYASAYIRRRDKAEPWDCHVVIFNFGGSIYSSLSTLPPQATLRRDAEAVIRRHERSFDGRWIAENFWTLFALQDGVSRYNTETGDRLGARGHGTVELIESLQLLGGSTDPARQPRMCIVSGRTHILFDGRFRMRDESFAPGQKRKVIAFNASNSLYDLPDDNTVSRLESPFPGTLISTRFYLDEFYLARTETPYGRVHN